MPTDPQNLTLTLILTAAGATVAAGLITGFIELLKRLGEGFGGWVQGHAPLLAFGLSAVLVAVAYADTLVSGAAELGIPTAFGAFLAWYGIATIATGTYDTTRRLRNGGS